jgi:hypothetical protein
MENHKILQKNYITFKIINNITKLQINSKGSF